MDGTRETKRETLQEPGTDHPTQPDLHPRLPTGPACQRIASTSSDDTAQAALGHLTDESCVTVKISLLDVGSCSATLPARKQAAEVCCCYSGRSGYQIQWLQSRLISAIWLLPTSTPICSAHTMFYPGSVKAGRECLPLRPRGGGVTIGCLAVVNFAIRGLPLFLTSSRLLRPLSC